MSTVGGGTVRAVRPGDDGGRGRGQGALFAATGGVAARLQGPGRRWPCAGRAAAWVGGRVRVVVRGWLTARRGAARCRTTAPDGGGSAVVEVGVLCAGGGLGEPVGPPPIPGEGRNRGPAS